MDIKKIIIFLLIGLGLVSCNGTLKKDSLTTKDSQVPANWHSNMHQLSLSLSKLMPLAVSATEFNKPENLKTIKVETKKIVDITAHLKKDKLAPDGDPSLNFSAEKFHRDMVHSYNQLTLGNNRYARHLIKNTANYCFGCHSRTNQGREGLNWSWGIDVSKFPPLDRALYFSAVREYDKALVEYDKVLNNKTVVAKDPYTWELSAKKSLAIAVRVKRDPQLAYNIVNRFLAAKSVPVSLRQTALEWRNSIKQWNSEATAKKKATNVTRRQQLEKAKSLVQEAWKTLSFPQSGAGVVYYLRASTELHDLLKNKVEDKTYGEALYMAGVVAESLKDINLWTLHEAYYEACIRKFPRTALAKKCYLRYESVILGTYFKDNYNTMIPAHIQNHLDKLKDLAERGGWDDILQWEFAE